MTIDGIFEAIEGFFLKIYEIIANVFKIFEKPQEDETTEEE